MTNAVAIIPARKGSKGVPGKNVKLLGNIPLIAHTIIEAKKVISPDRIFVSTDSTQIADIANEYGVRPSVLRPESLSLDELRTRKSKTKLIGIVIDRKVNLIDKRVFFGSNVVGKITSNTWSPRYSAFLAFARCELKDLEDTQNLHIKTTSGEVSVRITDLPFDFKILGLTGIEKGTSI